MKPLMLFLPLLLIASCNTSKNVTAYVKKHCSEVHSVNLETGNVEIKFACDSLYNADDVKKVCPKAIACFDVANGGISGEVVCGSEETTLVEIFKNLFSKIKFKK